jgi:hypothetical protein
MAPAQRHVDDDPPSHAIPNPTLLGHCPAPGPLTLGPPTSWRSSLFLAESFEKWHAWFMYDKGTVF